LIGDVALEPTENSDETIASQTFPQEATQKYVGVSGWLFIFAIGVFLNPLIIGNDLITSSKDWAGYKTMFPDSIVPSFSIIADILGLVLMLFGAYLFLKKKRVLRKFYSWSLPVIAFLYYVVYNLMATDIESLVQSGRIVKASGDLMSSIAIKPAARALLLVFIWVPYLIRSKRVRATFVK
jgi:hypothetical protein